MSGISSAKFDVVKFDRFGNFGLWQRRVKDLLVQQGMVKALYGKQPEEMNDMDWKDLEVKVVATIKFCLADDVMYHVMDEESPVAIWLKLESRYMSKSLMNKLYLKQKLYGLKMTEGLDLSQHINMFNKVISDFKIITCWDLFYSSIMFPLKVMNARHQLIIFHIVYWRYPMVSIWTTG